MPSLPLPEPDEEAQSNAEVIRSVVRNTVAAAVPKEIGLRPWLALIVVLVVVATNTTSYPWLAIVGALNVLYLAVDLTRVGKR